MARGAVALIALVLLVYRPVWTAAWVFEDTETMNYTTRTVTTATWQVVRSPLGAHMLSLSLSFLLAALLLLFARRLGVRGIGLWLIAVIQLLHPINVESVAYAASRGELLAAIFILGACLLATREWRGHIVIGIILCLLGAMFSKESGLVGIILVPAVVVFLSPRSFTAWLPVALAVWLVSLSVWNFDDIRAIANYGTTDYASTVNVSWFGWAELQIAATGYWLTSIITLNGFTPDPDIDLISITGRWLSLAALVGIAIVSWLARRRAPITSFGLAWFLLALFPRFIVQEPQGYLTAHHMLTPDLGLWLAVGGMRRI